jgi:hypothetical protein
LAARAKDPAGAPRGAGRHPIDWRVPGEHRLGGDVMLRLVNISPAGFMTRGSIPLGKGERLMLALPVIGRIEAFVVWISGERAGFQFERLLRPREFGRMLELLQSGPRQPPG